MDNAEKELLFSLSKAYDLYNYMLQLIVAVTKEARKRYDVELARAQREGAEAPSQKFAFNRLAVQLEENKCWVIGLMRNILHGMMTLNSCASSTLTLQPARLSGVHGFRGRQL